MEDNDHNINHISTSIDTPMREDAFKLTDDEKYNMQYNNNIDQFFEVDPNLLSTSIDPNSKNLL